MKFQRPNKQTVFFSLVSLAAHVLVLGLTIACLNMPASIIKADLNRLAINSYLYTKMPSSTKSAATQKPVAVPTQTPLSPQLNHMTSKDPLATSKTASIQPEKAEQYLLNSQQPTAQLPENDKIKTDKLLALLHTAIGKQQQYPESAKAMEREGQVIVSFILQPDGQITQLQISGSSETLSLDEAALAAVSNAAPFSEARQYLKYPQKYSIAIIFALS